MTSLRSFDRPADSIDRSVDLRSRVDADQRPVEARSFFTETLPALLDSARADIAPGASGRKLVDLCIETDGEPYTLGWRGDHATVTPGHQGEARVRLTAEQLSDMVNDQSTPIALMSNAVLDMPEGGLPQLLDWWLVLRAALDGRRIYANGDIEIDRGGLRSFTPDDSDEDMRAYLEEYGYLHIEGLFTEDEMAAVEADYPRAAPHYEKGDPLAWFATTKDGQEHLVRMEGFDRYSEVTVELIDTDRFQRIGGIPGIGHVQKRAPGARVGALSKPIGVVKGISDVPWHKDCSLGRHSYECCSLTVGISVNGAGKTNGQLRVVPGSHRALVWPAPCVQPGIDLEPVDLPTRTGDVTVHLSCTQHMSQPPVESPRKVLYTGWGQRPVDPAAAEQNRRRLNDVRSKTHTSISQEPGHLSDG